MTPPRVQSAQPNPLDSWPAFADRVRERLEAGRTAYGDRSFSREPAELVRELQAEALDMAGWGFVLWQRLESALAALEPVEAPEKVYPGKQAQPTVERNLQHVGNPAPWAFVGSVDAATLAELAMLSERMGLSPGAVLKLALAALRQELERAGEARRARRLVGGERVR